MDLTENRSRTASRVARAILGALIIALVAIGTAAMLSPIPSAPPTPAYFCPAGEHVVKVVIGLPECAR